MISNRLKSGIPVCFLLALSLSLSCGQGNWKESASAELDSLGPNAIEKKGIDYHVNIGLLTGIEFEEEWDWMFQNVKGAKLSFLYISDLEQLLLACLKEHNKEERERLDKHNREHPRNKWKETGFELDLRGKRRQYVCVINEQGDREFWINFFCGDFSSGDWEKELVIVEDGGNCYFSVKINLDKKTCYDLRVNGYA